MPAPGGDPPPADTDVETQETSSCEPLTPEDRRLARRFFAGAGIFFALRIGLRVVTGGALSFDEGEQVLLSQWLAPGYAGQPPLYVWMQRGLFALLGANLFALSLLKNALFFASASFLFLAGRRLLRDSRLAVLAALSLLVIPPAIWETHRNSTNSALATAAASGLLYVTLRLLEAGSTRLYLAAGALFAAGALGKYNFLLFAGALVATLLSTERGRALLGRRRALAALVPALAIPAPHLAWAIVNRHRAGAAIGSLEIASEWRPFVGLGWLALAWLIFAGPLAATIYLFFRTPLRREGPRPFRGAALFPLGRLLAIELGLLLAMALFANVAGFRHHWLLPLFFPLPIWLLGKLPPEALRPFVWRLLLRLSAAVAAAFALAMTWPLYAVHLSTDLVRPRYPTAAVAEAMRAEGFPGGVIVATDVAIAGGLRLRFPGSLALAPHPGIGDARRAAAGRPVLVLATGPREEATRKARDLAASAAGLDLGLFEPKERTVEDPGLPGRTVRVRFRILAPGELATRGGPRADSAAGD